VFIRVHLWLKTLAKLAQLTESAVGRDGRDTPATARPRGSAHADLLLMTGQNTSVSALIGGTGRKIAMDIEHVVVLMLARRCGRLCRSGADRPPMMAIFGLASTIRNFRLAHAVRFRGQEQVRPGRGRVG
jgi:hypothetical protein